MEKIVFDGELERLNQQFPKWVVTGEMRDKLFLKLRHLPGEIFGQIIDDIMLDVTGQKIRLRDFEERISKFGGHIRSIRVHEDKYFEEPENTAPCKHCNRDGYVPAKKDGHSYMFKCFCKNGQMRKDSFPVWGKRWLGEGYSNSRHWEEK